MASTQINRNILLVGAAVCGGSLLGCDAPESGSLENAKNRPIDYNKLDYNKLDYNKLDYGKLDYGKIDYGKIDYGKLDPAKLTPDLLAKLPEKQLASLASSNVGLVPSTNVSDEVARRLNNRRVEAEKAGDKELLANIDKVLESIKLSKALIGADALCW